MKMELIPVADETSEEENDGPDWAMLQAELGSDALAALRNHMDNPSQANERDQPLGFKAVSNAEFRSGPVLVESNLDFKKHSYWEERFEIEDEYEWLANFESSKKSLVRYLGSPSSTPKILVVGCGNSNFSADLYDAGWTNVTSIDFSDVVIERMRLKNADSRWLF
jgi:SAM-dependent methyltransferase